MASEDFLDEKLKHPSSSTDNSDINRMINTAIKNHHKVYLMGDWHLYKRIEKGKPACKERQPAFNHIIANIRKDIGVDDVFIYMGDVVDGEFQEKDKLKRVLRGIPLPQNSIMVRGNNDTFDKSFYNACGFKYVVDQFIWGDIIFTHIPVKNHNSMNIHSHLHSGMCYWIPYTNQIDVAYLGSHEKPVELQDVINAQKSYSKLITEKPEMFDEHYVALNIFHEAFHVHMIEDPFDD